MLKHRGFPGRLPSTDHQFTIRRANPKGATKLAPRERYRDRSAGDRLSLGEVRPLLVEEVDYSTKISCSKCGKYLQGRFAQQ